MIFAFALSGLQNFVYNLSPDALSREDRQTQGGRETYAARRLRIRSALLSLAPAVVAWEIQQSDPGSQVVYLGGGKLIILASAEAIEAVEPKLRDLYSWLLLCSSGTLGAYWAAEPAEEANSDSVRAAIHALGQAKWRAGRFDTWPEAAFAIQSGAPKESLGDRDWESKQGAQLARRQELAGFAVGNGGWPLGPWSIRPVTDNPDIALAGRAQAQIQVSIPTHAPSDQDGTVAELFKLAEEAEGAPYLALLKLDGDGIGKMIQGALEEGIQKYENVSRKLSNFFGPDLMALLDQKHPRIYLVYSGGDDLVATGHFNAVLACARDVQRHYDKLGLGTVSAGISFYARNSPVLNAVEAAETELKNAKRTRNAVSLGGCRCSWQDFGKAMDAVDGLVQAIRQDTLNRGALQLLKQLGEPWLDGTPPSLSETRWRSIPQLAYTRSRRTGWKEKEWPKPVLHLFDSLQANPDDWPRAALVGTLAAWRTKIRQEDQ